MTLHTVTLQPPKIQMLPFLLNAEIQGGTAARPVGRSAAVQRGDGAMWGRGGREDELLHHGPVET